ncbi:type IX secretion system motor protein PorM/GldM [Sediminibacterium soli]|uniref:type IX secretion system motor protein PorM/GldM n=1 Tax=Sediminibacterium soli TaxID=2698829 RepID=UPI00137950CA|nr:gliding motility protein GldM [Sediminibacterium soli]NCI45432.1 gliding motility protein GldM [Sediminibacterium soli]
MALPKEPRQKMINIMYLVLTALLALNVSAEILNAFKTVDRSLMTANEIIEKKNEDIFKSFKQKLEKPETREKAQIWLPKAEQAKKLADDMYTYLDGLKKELKQESGVHMVDGVEVYKEDDLESSTRMFVEDAPGGKGRGKELFQRLTEFKKKLMEIDPEIKKDLEATLPLDLSIPKTNNAAGKDNWAYNYFHMTPSVASITILSKFQNDIKNSESQVVEYCHKEIGEVELIYDEFQAFAGTNSQYLMPGEQLVITAGVGAFSKAAKPTVTVDGATVPLKPDGTAEYTATVGNSGAASKKVVITFKKPDGTISKVEKEVKYTVGVPSGLVVSTDKTRVFYQDLENPLNVTGGGGDEKVNLTVDGPGITSRKVGAGQYMVVPKQLGSATVVATDGKTTQRITIPIKRVPDPIATVGGKAGGPIAANVFRVQRGVAAELRDFVFEGVKYDVVSFTFVCTGKGFEESGMQYAEVSGAYFSGEAQNFMKRLQAGSTVVIDEIKVRGPGGTRTLDQNISFTLQ